MLKRCIAFIFLLSFATQTFSKAFVIADYYLNTASFAKNCENKARPVMHCNGKCQMMKKLKEEEKKDQQNSERRAQNKNETALSSKSFFANAVPVANSELLITIFPVYNDDSSVAMSHAVFHPPSC